jgi:hypothetical protein
VRLAASVRASRCAKWCQTLRESEKGSHLTAPDSLSSLIARLADRKHPFSQPRLTGAGS